MSDKILFSSKICPFDEMTCLVCTFDEHEKRDKSAPSVFHHRILKCRILIFSLNDILSAPSYNNNLQIYVIIKRDLNNNEMLLKCLDKNNLKVLQSTAVNANTFEACLKYTLIAKLAPLWNQIQTNLLVKGRDFLHSRLPLNALTLNIFVFENLVILEIKCLKIRLSPVRINDLNFTDKAINYFNQTPNATLPGNSLINRWVYVLPSLKKGQIISVNKGLPQSSLFQSYKDLNRHWKNIYGYRIPQDITDILFLEIHFKPLGPQLYTYPSICLQTNLPLHIVPTANTIKIITNDFLHDLKKCLSHVLGFPTNFNHFDNVDSFDHKPTQLHDFNCFEKPNFSNWEDSYMKNNECSNENCLTQNISLCTPTQNIPKKPTFFPKKQNNIQHSQENDFIDKKITQYSSPSSEIATNNVFKPIFYSKKNKENNNAQKSLFKQNECQDLKHFKNMNVECSQSQPTKFQNMHFSPTTSIKQDFTNVKVNQNVSIINKNNDRSVNALNTAQKNSERDNHHDTLLKLDNENKMQCTKNDFSDFNDSTPINNSLSQNKDTVQEALRMLSSSIPAPKIAKPKSKNINSTVNIPLLANTDPKGLFKLNVPTLYSWLKSQNVHVTTKMLKQQLVEKVFEHLNLKSE